MTRNNALTCCIIFDFYVPFRQNYDVYTCNCLGNEDIQFYKFLHKFSDSRQIGYITLQQHEKDFIISNFVQHFEMHENGIKNKVTELNCIMKARLKDYKWNVTVEECYTKKRVIIRIDETCWRNYTSGGSSFTILQTSAHIKDFCPITDLYNGTYIAVCHIQYQNVTIKGTVHYVNFTAFSSTETRFRKVICTHAPNMDVSLKTLAARINHGYYYNKISSGSGEGRPRGPCHGPPTPAL